tara:strand:- start:154 stop:930 length:777 start_codon:yes stop_codon:yes gene_type:complete
MKEKLFIFFCFSSLFSFSQDICHWFPEKCDVSIANSPENKIALVIANSNYETDDLDLKNPKSDAKLMSKSFEKLGFSLIVKQDLTKDDIYSEIESFKQNLKNYDFGIIYYAGHAIQNNNGDSYLLTTDYNENNKIEDNGVNISDLVLYFEKINKKCLIILDACRNVNNNGLPKPSIEDPLNTKLAFSTSFGKTASDNSDLDNTIYSFYLAKLFLIDGLSIHDIFHNTSKKVLAVTNNNQYPVDYFGITIEDIILKNTR